MMINQPKDNQTTIRCKYWVELCLLVIFAFLSPMLSARAAQCSAAPRIPLNLSAPEAINIDPSIAIGQVIGSSSISWPTTPVSCSMMGDGRVIGVGSPNGNIYPTTIPGIGYRAKVTSAWVSGLQTYWPTSVVNGNYGNSGSFTYGNLLFELVKTGPISSSGGTFGPGVIGTVNISGSVSGDYLVFNLISPVIIKPTVPACTVTQSAITVNLDDANTSQLAMLGNTSKDKEFSIPLNCNSASNLSLAFSGDIADNTNAVFSNLSGSANATTVGVQILSGVTPVPTTAGSYLNLGLINGPMSVPLTARYYALANNANAGAVSAIAYATIIYN